MLPQGKNGGYKWTDNRPLRAGKGFPYEGGIREPFIVKWPGVTDPGSQCDVPVSTIDILPTICAIINRSPPSDTIIDGENIVPLLGGETPIDRKALFWHFPHYWANQTVRPNSVIRTGDWKLIRWYEDNKLELFNLKEDVAEQRDLAQDLPEKVRELEIKLDKWLKDTNAKFPIKNPNYSGIPE
jgi:arylsulfatase A-like enzyme